MQDFSQPTVSQGSVPRRKPQTWCCLIYFVSEWYRKRKSSTEIITDNIYIYRDLRTYSFMRSSQKVVAYLHVDFVCCHIMSQVHNIHYMFIAYICAFAHVACIPPYSMPTHCPQGGAVEEVKDVGCTVFW